MMSGKSAGESTALNLKAALRAEAARLGFSLFGVTTPERPPHFETYRQWIEAGRHGEMHYLANEEAVEKRGDPKRILPECRSIIVAGLPYSNPVHPEVPSEGDQPLGRIAAYAWGDDYHEILIPRLKELIAFIRARTQATVLARPYTDTGPILERDLAQRAGLGWFGKNTCLIHPKMGSYFLLAEILLDVPLPPDEPFTADHCGTCTRCITACPTGCIRPDRTIDATRCISYLTIENKGSIPRELRPLIGDWVFGCDICQMVCPWNRRFANQESDPAFAPRPGIPRPSLRADLHLTPQAFNRKFKNSPVRRAKRRGYLRNIAVALGNLRAVEAIPDLAAVMQSEPEALVRAHTAWALGQMQTTEAKTVLETALQTETDASVREEIQLALAIYGSQSG